MKLHNMSLCLSALFIGRNKKRKVLHNYLWLLINTKSLNIVGWLSGLCWLHRNKNPACWTLNSILSHFRFSVLEKIPLNQCLDPFAWVQNRGGWTHSHETMSTSYALTILNSFWITELRCVSVTSKGFGQPESNCKEVETLYIWQMPWIFITATLQEASSS